MPAPGIPVAAMAMGVLVIGGSAERETVGANRGKPSFDSLLDGWKANDFHLDYITGDADSSWLLP